MGFYAIDTLINEAKRRGVRVLPINPNLSGWDARIEGAKTVRMGFRNVRRIREEDVKWMNEESERELRASDFKTRITEGEMHGHFLVLETERAKGHFRSLYDFMKRTRFSREVIELMAMANVFSCFGQDQRHSFWQSLAYHGILGGILEGSAQLSLFSEDPLSKKQVPVFEEMTLLETIAADYRALGYSTDGNLMVAIRRLMPGLPQLTSAKAKKLRHGNRIHYAGILTVNQRPPTAKGVAFLTIEDDEGSLDFIVKKELYERFENIIVNHRFLEVKGRLQRVGEGSSVLLSDVRPFFVEGESARSVSHGTTSRGFGSPLSL